MRLHNVVRRPVISSCGSPREKCFEFLDQHLKRIIQEDCSCIKDSGDFINKTKNVSSIPENATVITVDVAELYASISYEADSRTLRESLDKQNKKSISEDLVKMAELVLKNNFFEFNSKIRQVSGTVIGITICVSFYRQVWENFSRNATIANPGCKPCSMLILAEFLFLLRWFCVFFEKGLPCLFFYCFYIFIYDLWFVTFIDKPLFELLTILIEVIWCSQNLWCSTYSFGS